MANSDNRNTCKQKYDQIKEETVQNLEVGTLLAHPPPGDEVVVTGMSGRFPNSDDIYQYRDNLLNKVDMVTSDNRRWEPTHPEIPQRTGKLNFIDKFDPGFFGIHYREAHQMDPMCRQVMERAIEAILDAGFHPNELRGTRTGVFLGACFSESEKTWFYDRLDSPTYGITGCARSMLTQHISYYLGLEGPSYVIDTACSSSLYTFEHAYRAIREGKCDNALVCGTSLCLHPIVSLQFARLGVLSLDGSCKSFDADANGYARAETVSVVYLQKAKDAKRIYAQVIHVKTNCDGYKEQGITYPSGSMQKQLLEDVYRECNIDPTSIDFLEAHATGTKVGDPEEIVAMDEVFCKSRKTPLYIGSIKSNLGHTEPASGMCSLVKVILGMENNCLLPNIGYKRPREGAEALEKGRMIVVTETTPWPSNGSGLAAINSFGFGGANCHALLKRYTKAKVNHGQPRDNLPRLVCVSGRTEKAIQYVLDDVKGRAFDAEYIRLLHEIFRNNLKAHPYRGYAVTSKTGELDRSFKHFEGVLPQLVLFFSGVDKKWLEVGHELLEIPIFASTIQKIYDILSPKGINITEIIIKKSLKNIVDLVTGTVAVQIALIDIIKSLDIKINYLMGYSIGELVSAYADDALTIEQAILSTYYIGYSLCEINHEMSSSKEVIDASTELIVHLNLAESAECSHDHGTESKIVVESTSNTRFKCAGKTCQQLLQRLNKLLPRPNLYSSKRITNCANETQFGSAEYFIGNLLRPFSLHTIKSSIAPGSTVLVIGPEVNFSNLVTVNLVSTKQSKNAIVALLHGLGRLYELGYNFKLEKLYPEIKWPVSVGTPMISPVIKWNHSEDWFVALFKAQERMKSGDHIVSFSIKDTDWTFLSGHVIDGRNLIPATGYLCLVWETFSMVVGLLMSEMKVVFKNVRFHRATNIPKSTTVALTIMIQKVTGMFEVAEMGQPVCSGLIYDTKHISEEMAPFSLPIEPQDAISLSSKDIYKILKLRGYNYSGIFRGLKSCNLNGTKGCIEWNGNWIGFMDNMLQMKLLQEDTQNLYVPTGIEQLAIDAASHIRYTKQLGENPAVPVYIHQESGIIKSGSIEIRGLTASSITRRKPSGEPVLEAYKFVPFQTNLTIEQSIRVCVQLLLENNYGIKMRVVEVFDDTRQNATPLGPLIHQALSDQPLIQPEIVVLSKQPLEIANVFVENKKLTEEKGTCSLIVLSDISRKPQIIKQALDALKENGMIMTRENAVTDLNIAEKEWLGLEILSIYQTEQEKIILLRKTAPDTPETVIDISESYSNFVWLEPLQAAVKNDEKVILLAQNAPINGIVGFVNCLRREPGGMNVRCVFIIGKAPKFDVSNQFYFNQLSKGLAINIFKDGNWGTYRHLPLENAGIFQREHVFNNVTVKGDLSSLRWIEGPLTSNVVLPPEKTLVHIYCAAINFRDIMTASGRINSDVITRDRIEQYNVQGFEFSGRDSTGKRIMGMIPSGALASMVNADSHFIWEIPKQWSMEDAATIPVTYGTVMQSLIVIAHIKFGQSILIHSGSGGVGQAAINIALSYKCNIFTTVGTQEKRDFIRNQFPQIPESNIGCSRDTSFEQMVFKETKGRGVDIVLNSLAEEKLIASVRCLAPGGKFIEIGKFDLVSDNRIGLKHFSEGRSFHGVMLDSFFVCSPVTKHIITNLISEGIRTGAIKPLNRITFESTEVEKAFRYMANGKHTGKVIIKIRPEEAQNKVAPRTSVFDCIARFHANSDKCYIICGGLGGFGLELTDWLVIRGARNLVLVSRNGVKTGYQASKIRIWKSYGVTTIVSTDDITTREGCVALMNKAKELGTIDGIFNLAAVLKDGLLENQTMNNFITSLSPKAVATLHLDEISRETCPELRYFVVFSSVSCGRGNAGQTNYGMANSVMEKICEQRKSDGYPALAIQWGAIGEVGLVADLQDLQTEIDIGGTLQQRIVSCLSVMDTFLSQDEPVVSSIVVAEKKGGTAGAVNIIDAVKYVMGIRDLKTISLHATLPELGMDSMMAVEIKQTLEREHEVFLTAQDIRNMTFTRLLSIAQDKMKENDDKRMEKETQKLPKGIYLLFRDMGNEDNATVPIVKLTSLAKEKSVAPKVFLLPGIEGMASVMEPLAHNLTSHVFCLQYIFTDQPHATIEDLTKSLLLNVKSGISRTAPFTLVGYSYGCVIALHLASLLEEEGYTGRVILIDGSPAMCKELIKQQIPEDSLATRETFALCALLELFYPIEEVLKVKNDIYNCKTLDDRVTLVLNYASDKVPHSKKYQRQVYLASCTRTNSVSIYEPNFRKLKSLVMFFKPSHPTVEIIDPDYKVQELCENPVEVLTFEGNHLTILKNPQVGYAINKIIDTSSVYFKQSITNDSSIDTIKNIIVKQI